MKRCLACDGENLKLVLDLGKQPLANSYDNDGLYPLALNACEDCNHAQLTESVQPKELYTNYYYVSGTSNTLKQWFADFAERFDPVGDILDVASNDGSLLLEFRKRGWETLGVDPAKNLDTQGIVTIHDFFGEDWNFGNKKFDIITAFNVVAHGPDPLSILKGIYNNLKDDGEAYVMTSQCKMFENGQFDTVYHEHHSFFNLHSFQTLANRAGFTDISYTIEPIHGGSYLFKLTKDDNYVEFPVKRPDYEGFVDKVGQIRPYKIVGYGAAAKAVVVINSLGQKLDYVVDDAPLKIGKKIQGTDIPIVSPDYMAEDNDNLIIIVYAWNFLPEIKRRIRELRPDRDDVILTHWN